MDVVLGNLKQEFQKIHAANLGTKRQNMIGNYISKT